MEAAVSFDGVARSFGPVEAIAGLDLAVPKGTVCVLLGANGAGKTTTLRLVTGVVRADRGSIRVLGLEPRTDGQAIRRRCGVVPPKPALYERLTGRQNLAYSARLFGVDAPPVGVLSERFGIAHALEQKVGGYSTGMRARLAIVRALLHDPELLLLDEPTAGLDPEAARAVRELILEIAGGGKTVVMSTHLLHEAEGAVDQVVMMDAGRAWAAGTPRELALTYWTGTTVGLEADNPDLLALALAEMQVESDRLDGRTTVVLDSIGDVPDLVAALVRRGVRLLGVNAEQPTLERLYFEMRRRARGGT